MSNVVDKLTRIFPEYYNKQLCFVDLNIYAQYWLTANPQVTSADLLQPSYSWKMVMQFHQENNAAWSYGGYLEDRSTLLAAGYQAKNGAFIHLGIDVNLEVGTKVHAPLNGKILVVDDEKDFNGGWGPRIIMHLDTEPKYVMIFSHLQNITVEPGEEFKLGQILGEIGKAPDNGNWWPHLHIQLVERIFFDDLIKKNLLLENLDGYSTIDNLQELKQRYPNPLEIL